MRGSAHDRQDGDGDGQRQHRCDLEQEQATEEGAERHRDDREQAPARLGTGAAREPGVGGDAGQREPQDGGREISDGESSRRRILDSHPECEDGDQRKAAQGAGVVSGEVPTPSRPP